jgi:hypothetical protein
MEEGLARAKASLLAAQSRQKLFADQKRREVEYKVGDDLLLSTINFKLKHPGTRKLLPKWVGPFKVKERIGKVAYKLTLPDNLKMHNVFHVQLLKPYRTDGQVKPPPPPIEIDDSLEYEVERVLEHREVKRGKQIRKEYLIKWLGYHYEHNTWEPEKHLAGCKDILTQYWAEVASAPQGVRERAAKLREERKKAVPKRKRQDVEPAEQVPTRRQRPSRR